MPKETYYNLAAQKRHRIFDAAVEELIRVPVSEMSINQIVQNAGISRGSFYQYFEDKYDLVQYVLTDYVDQLEEAARRCMEQCGGNPFDGLTALFRTMIELAEDETVRRVLINLIMETSSRGCTFAFAAGVQNRIVEVLAEMTDRSLLVCEDEGSVRRLIRVLFAVLKEAAAQCLYNFEGAEGVREEFTRTMDLLQDRMERR